MEPDDDVNTYNPTSDGRERMEMTGDSFNAFGYIAWSIWMEVEHYDPKVIHRIEYAFSWLTKRDAWEGVIRE